ncbi:unnamed protein product [Moneuplotes crassus]|uniref:Nudix hydrolase domain-containing protein n=1 Tax=Euplotes crassus TaxID=5936 RepID=A0AAD1XJZ9_EUPCR|nr:unnamed protein product [Moneuplotes crassus]
MDLVFGRVPKSSSVLFVKRHKVPKDSIQDYDIFIFQRNPNTKFGGLYAYPGGKIESQDSIDHWESIYKHCPSSFARFEDFSLRITCLRELYEECFILPCYQNGEFKVLTKEDIDTSEIKTDRFPEFCKSLQVLPALDRLKAWKRITPPHNISRRDDTLIYLYFIENDEDDSIILNQDELTEYISGSPCEIMKQYSDGEILMVLPQPVTICWCGYFTAYDELKMAAEKADNSIATYFEMRSDIVPVPDSSLNRDTKINSISKFSEMFNDFDYLEPEMRDEKCQLILFDTQVPEEYQFNNEQVMKRIMNKGENDGLKIMIRIYPGDFAHPNESFPWVVKPYYRHRVYYYAYRIFRYEISRPIFERYFKYSGYSKI